MGESVDSENGTLFQMIIADMKAAVPMWEDFIVKASKFYTAVKATAATADAFLDSFQKMADATTSSKGATRDIGVLLTKLVMRHRSIENKLKTYIGILTDSFISPLQEKLEEWRKITSQCEKDHYKDLKKIKSETKRAVADVQKLKKKVSRKGRIEYQDQYKEALRIASGHCSTLEEHEKLYLRKLMLEERSRAAFFFSCYKPVVEQELSMVSEIEHLESVLEETVKHCRNPHILPDISEDAITGYKAPERALLGKEEETPPVSPVKRDRANSVTSTTSSTSGSGSVTLTRSKTVSAGTGSHYGTLRKTGPPPKPVEIPKPLSPYAEPKQALSQDSTQISDDNLSAFSSMSSLSTNSGGNDAALGQDEMVDQQIDSRACYIPPDSNANNQNIHKAFRTATRTSWSSTETSDSSGIGSYCSLNSQGRFQNHRMEEGPFNGDSRAPEFHDVEVNEDLYTQMNAMHVGMVGSPRRLQQPLERGNFQRGTPRTSSLRGTSCTNGPGSYGRSNSLASAEPSSTPDYRMNLPRNRGNTISGRTLPAGAKPTVFQIYGNPTPSQLRAKLSPSNSPAKRVGPPPPSRKGSSPATYGQVPNTNEYAVPHGHMRTRSETNEYAVPMLTPYTHVPHTLGYDDDDEPPPGRPGSFLAELQRGRTVVRQRSLSNDHYSR